LKPYFEFRVSNLEHHAGGICSSCEGGPDHSDAFAPGFL
jgi:hypothetical protein